MEVAPKSKLAFVLPEYALDTHFRYVGEFAVLLLEHVDMYLILEKGRAPANFPKEKVRVQQFSFPPARFLEMGWILFSLHLRGYRTQYIHYSFVAGFWSALWTKLLGGSMYYWNAGMPWLYKRGAFREGFERLVFRMIDHLVTGADALHAGYAQYYRISRERIVTLPNWIDVESEQLKFASVDKAAVRNRLNIPEGSQVLLFVHRLAMRKGAHLLPEIFAGLQDRMMHRVFVIVGDGPERESIEQILRERGLWYNVRMLGSIPQESVHELYAIADLLLLPSEEEGFPHVLTEAQSIGLPYVASDVGGVREMTPPECSQSIVSYGDIASFNKAARVLLENAEYHCRFNKSVQVWVTRYDKTLILQRFIKLVTSKS